MYGDEGNIIRRVAASAVCVNTGYFPASIDQEYSYISLLKIHRQGRKH